MCESEPRALSRLPPLQLAEGGEESKDELAARGGRVDVAGGQTELCPRTAQAVSNVDGVPSRSSKPCQVVGDQNALGPAGVVEG